MARTNGLVATNHVEIPVGTRVLFKTICSTWVGVTTSGRVRMNGDKGGWGYHIKAYGDDKPRFFNYTRYVKVLSNDAKETFSCFGCDNDEVEISPDITKVFAEDRGDVYVCADCCSKTTKAGKKGFDTPLGKLFSTSPDN